MTKLQRTIVYGLLIILIASIISLIIVRYLSDFSEEKTQILWIVWLSTLIPTTASGFISAFLYRYLCEFKKRWAHILWFTVNLILIIIFGTFMAFVVLNSMLN